jgi:hypothetical protein
MSCQHLNTSCPKGALNSVTRRSPCGRCGATGQLQCTNCHGHGVITTPSPGMSVKAFNDYVTKNNEYPRCRQCGGSGQVRCPTCNATGTEESKYFERGPHVLSGYTNQEGNPCCANCGAWIC